MLKTTFIALGVAIIMSVAPRGALANSDGVCFEKARIGDWGIRADEANWKIFRRYDYVNFLSVFDDNISMISHPKLPGILEVTLNGETLVRHPASSVEHNIRMPDAEGRHLPVEAWFPEHGDVEVIIGHRNETGEEKPFITNIVFESSELVGVIARARAMRQRLEQNYRSGACEIDRFQRVIIVPG